MVGDTTKLTLRLSRENAAFVKAYAKAHGLSVTELIGRYLRRMAARRARADGGCGVYGGRERNRTSLIIIY